MWYINGMDLNGQAGKGDTYRPVNYKTWSKNFDAIFNKKTKPSKRKKKNGSK
jgi:hypothetical protein